MGKRGQRISLLAYADDITVRLTNPEDIEKVNQPMRTYEQATGSQLNLNKSRALAVGVWSRADYASGIDLFQQVKICGVTFGSTVDATVQESWTRVTNAVLTQARRAYARKLCLAHRVQYVQSYVLTKVWYLAQVLPLPTCHILQLTTTCTLFIWRGAYFRVPKTTLQWPKDQGGWALPDIALKCRALLLGRMRTLAAQKTSATAAFLRTWNLTDTVENPPYVGRIPSKLVHVRQYALDMAYVSPTCTCAKYEAGYAGYLESYRVPQRGAT
jgi:hypothetical protein